MSELDDLYASSLSGVPMRPRAPKDGSYVMAEAISKLAEAMAQRDAVLAATLVNMLNSREQRSEPPAPKLPRRPVTFELRKKNGQLAGAKATNGEQAWDIEFVRNADGSLGSCRVTPC